MSLLIEGPKGTRIGVFHFPKTSGTWLREVVKACPQLRWHDSPCKPTHSRHYGMYSWEGTPPDVALTLVREPKPWLESWWRFTQPVFPVYECGVNHPCRWTNRLTNKLGADAQDFNKYVQGMLDGFRGEIDNMFLHCTNRMDHVFKMENARQMLAEILDLAEVDADPDALADSVPPQNVSQKVETPWTQEQEADFHQATQLAHEIYQTAK